MSSNRIWYSTTKPKMNILMAEEVAAIHDHSSRLRYREEKNRDKKTGIYQNHQGSCEIATAIKAEEKRRIAPGNWARLNDAHRNIDISLLL